MLAWLNDMGFLPAVIVFAACAAIIGIVGTRLTRIADELADRTGIGEAVAGAVLLGATTSLSGIVLSVTAALRDQPALAMSNALGGIAVQTLFLAVADWAYRRANLEHAGASAANLAQATLLVCLLSVLLVASLGPSVTWLGINIATPVLFGGYLYGLRLVGQVHVQPMWNPRMTRETRTDEPEAGIREAESMAGLWIAFVGYAAVLGISGFVLERSASVVGAASGLSDTAVGVLLTAVCTSLPELVTSVAAVRRGALQLAIGGIIGGNAFDCLFAGAADIAYRPGSIYHAVANDTLVWIALSLLMTGVLLLGLIRREERGMANIGFESVSLIVLYGVGVVIALLH